MDGEDGYITLKKYLIPLNRAHKNGYYYKFCFTTNNMNKKFKINKNTTNIQRDLHIKSSLFYWGRN